MISGLVKYLPWNVLSRVLNKKYFNKLLGEKMIGCTYVNSMGTRRLEVRAYNPITYNIITSLGEISPKDLYLNYHQVDEY